MNNYYVFNKRVFRSVAAAEVVLGPAAVKEIIDQVVLDTVRDPAMRLGIHEILNYDPTKGAHVCVSMPRDPRETPKIKLSEARGQRVYQGYTLVDLETTLKESLDSDLIGTILEIIQLKWGKELTIDDGIELYKAITKIKALTTTKKEGDN